ncbi:hypothetical protein F5X98DRAFT_381491 [Xylaria grammica]|nr:hypothetical protein F5X98DRAFT_381491 [Xylaria grammica]
MHFVKDHLTTQRVPPFHLLTDEDMAAGIQYLAERACVVSQSQVEDHGSYQACILLRLPPHINLDRLKRAWETTVEKNAILRTRLIQNACGQVYQAVLLPEKLEWYEATSLDEYIKKDSLLAVTVGGPLTRVAIIKDDTEAKPCLVVTLHHALYDRWSFPLLFLNLQAAYLGQTPSPRLFNGFVNHIRQISDSQTSSIWKTEFEGLDCPQFPLLPTAHYTPSITDTLEHTLEHHGSFSPFTLPTIVRLAWATAISVYARSDEVVFGATVAGRSVPVPGIEDMTGPTIATVPIRAKVDPSRHINGALEDIRASGVRMIPFEQAGLQLIRTLSPETAQACQFQSPLVTQWVDEKVDDFLSFFVDYDYALEETAFSSDAINLTCDLSSSQVKFLVTYGRRVVKPPIMQMMLFQLCHATSRILATYPLVRDLMNVGPQGMRSVFQWNTDLPPRVNACVHNVILSYSERTPDAIAVVAWDGNLTYRDLDFLSLCLARNLLLSRVASETIVHLLFDKSVWTVVAILGTMRASAAFLLLDATQPLARLASLCRAVGAKIMVALEQHTRLASSLVSQRLVPIGGIGELIIEGPIVGRGYLNDPDQTAAAFIPRMQWLRRFRANTGKLGESRMYKTGDLVQLLPAGALKYIGRKDHQIKIRGQRVKLGGVENHVHCAFPRATNVAAELLRPIDQDSQPLLVAFVEVPGPADLRNHRTQPTEMAILPPTASFYADVKTTESQLQDVVPGYMIPSVFLPVNQIALMSGGKVDRRKLQDLGRRLFRKDPKIYVHAREIKRAPENETQQALQMLCAQVLNMPPDDVSMSESFLSLGGDSISAMSLAAWAHNQRITMKVRDILSRISIEGLAMRTVKSHLIQPSQTPEELDVPFTPSPIQTMFFDIVPLDCLDHYNQSFFISFTRPISVGVLHTAVKPIIRGHSMLRSRFNYDNGQWVQTITADSNSYIFRSSEVSCLADIELQVPEIQRSLNISPGVLLSVNPFHRVILRDLEQLLTRTDLTVDTSVEPSLSFQTWRRLQFAFAREHLPPEKVFLISNKNLERHHESFLDYWDLTGRQNNYSDAVWTGFTLDAGVTRNLLGSANDAFQTKPTDIFQAALVFSFNQQFPDRVSPTVFNESHGRETWDSSIDLSRTVAWFTTIWPTPNTISPGQSFVEVLKQTKDAKRQVPRNGYDYFTSRFLHPQGPHSLLLAVPMEIIINFAGSFQRLETKEALFSFPDIQYTELDVDVNSPRFELFEVSALVKGGRLEVAIAYHKHMPQDRIEKWAAAFQATLDEASIILSSIEKGFTVSDFPLLRTGYDGLEYMIEKVFNARKRKGTAEIEDAYPCTGIQKGILLIQLWDQVVLKHAAGGVAVLDRNTPYSGARDTSSVTALCPWQLTLIDRGETVLCDLCILHALVDGFSMSVLQQQLIASYEDEKLPRPIAVFKDYVSCVQDLPYKAATELWTEHLRDVDPCIMPTLNNASDQPESRATYVCRTLGNTHSLKSYCEANGVTMFNLVQLSWGLVLRAYTGLDTACFGYLVSGRNIAINSIEQIIGPLNNMLVCHINMNDGNSTVDLARSIHSDYLQELEYQHTSLVNIHNSLRVSTNRLFNIVVAFQVKPKGNITRKSSSLSIRPVAEDDPTEYDLTLNRQISDLATSFEAALFWAVGPSNTSIRSMELLGESHMQWLRERNQAAPKACKECIHGAIAPFLSSTPFAPAACAWDGSFTYRDLDHLSFVLSKVLTLAGVVPETYVAIHLEKRETPSHNDVKTWHSEVSLRETYGPTECTVLATVNQDISSNPRNISHESGCVCWIAQAENHDELMPIGAIGELLIEGPILGRGYVDDPVRTSTVFVENPSWATKLGLQRDVRLYKTGDLAYYTYDGSICYV